MKLNSVAPVPYVGEASQAEQGGPGDEWSEAGAEQRSVVGRSVPRRAMLNAAPLRRWQTTAPVVNEPPQEEEGLVDTQVLAAARRTAKQSQATVRTMAQPDWERREAVGEAVEEGSMDGSMDGTWADETAVEVQVSVRVMDTHLLPPLSAPQPTLRAPSTTRQVVDAVETQQLKAFESALAMPKARSPSLERAMRPPAPQRPAATPQSPQSPQSPVQATASASQLRLSQWSTPPPPPEPAEAAPPLPWMQGADCLVQRSCVCVSTPVQRCVTSGTGSGLAHPPGSLAGWPRASAACRSRGKRSITPVQKGRAWAGRESGRRRTCESCGGGWGRRSVGCEREPTGTVATVDAAGAHGVWASAAAAAAYAGQPASAPPQQAPQATAQPTSLAAGARAAHPTIFATHVRDEPRAEHAGAVAPRIRHPHRVHSVRATRPSWGLLPNLQGWCMA
jgi:hypothetical protein